MSVVDFAHAIGAKVLLLEINRPAIVTACMVEADGKQYRVVYWNDGQRKCEWVHDFEIEDKRE
jgi:hypothetical protein